MFIYVFGFFSCVQNFVSVIDSFFAFGYVHRRTIMTIKVCDLAFLAFVLKSLGEFTFQEVVYFRVFLGTKLKFLQ